MYKVVTLAVLSLLAVGCSVQRPVRPTIVPVESNSSIRVVHTIRVDTARFTLPLQRTETTTPADSSYLETDYAESDARINADGTLTHTLHNKEQEIPVPVQSSADTVYVAKYTEKPVEVPVPVEVERKLTPWERARLSSWPWLALALTLCAGYVFRKPIIAIIGRFVKLP